MSVDDAQTWAIICLGVLWMFMRVREHYRDKRQDREDEERYGDRGDLP